MDLKEKGVRRLILVEEGQFVDDDDYGDKRFTKSMMTHNLKGDICKFTVLEHIDTGSSRSTDLDLVVLGEDEEAKNDAKLYEETKAKLKDCGGDGGGGSGSGSSEVVVELVSKKEKVWMCDSDREDLITVKYLPLLKTTGTNQQTTEKVDEGARQYEEHKESLVSINGPSLF